MKVIVAKMPGGAAVSVSLEEGATIMDAITAAGYADGLENGFELRKNDSPAGAGDAVAQGDIISLTAKIKGNAIGALHLMFVSEKGTAEQSFVRTFPLKAKDFFAPENENEALAVQGFILANSGKDQFDSEDYIFACIKEGQEKPISFKKFNCCNYIASDSLVVICEKKFSFDPHMAPAKFYEESLSGKVVIEPIEPSEIVASDAVEAPKKKKATKAKKKAAKKCECESTVDAVVTDEICKCDNTGECDNSVDTTVIPDALRVNDVLESAQYSISFEKVTLGRTEELIGGLRALFGENRIAYVSVNVIPEQK